MRTLTIAVIALLAAPAAASAQRPAIDVARAQARVEAYAQTVMHDDNEATRTTPSLTADDRRRIAEGGFDPADFEPGPIVTSVDVECEAETRLRALCGIDFHLADGNVREQEVEVIVTRHGGLRLDS